VQQVGTLIELHTICCAIKYGGSSIVFLRLIRKRSVRTLTVTLDIPTEVFHVLPQSLSDRGGTVVKVLYYKSEGSWFDSRWCHWNFH
jgi:hypothetical protein